MKTQHTLMGSGHVSHLKIDFWKQIQIFKGQYVEFILSGVVHIHKYKCMF